MIETKEGVKIKISRSAHTPSRIQVEYYGPGSLYRHVFLTYDEADRVADDLLEAAHEAYLAAEEQ